jgi:hypothetical protein
MGTFNKNIAAGNAYAFGGFLDSLGFLTGGSPDVPANGSSSGMFRIDAVKSASPAVPEPDSEIISGDDQSYGEFTFDSIAERKFTVEFAVQDMLTDSRILGVNLETFGEIVMGAMDIENAPERDLAAIFQSRAKKQGTGIKGQKGWSGTMVALATGKPLGRAAFEERTGAAYRLSLTPQIAQYNPWGVTLADASTGTTGLRYRPFTSEYPIHMQSFTGDGATTEFDLDFEPISVAKCYAVVGRVVVTVASITAATKKFALSAAPAGGARGIILYQFQG